MARVGLGFTIHINPSSESTTFQSQPSNLALMSEPGKESKKMMESFGGHSAFEGAERTKGLGGAGGQNTFTVTNACFKRLNFSPHAVTSRKINMVDEDLTWSIVGNPWKNSAVQQKGSEETRSKSNRKGETRRPLRNAFNMF